MGMGKIKALKIRSIGFFAPDFLHVAFLGFSAKKRLRQKLKVMSEILSVPASRNNFAKKDRIDYSCGGAACFWCCVICPEDADLAFIPAEVRLAITIKSMMMDTIIRISWTEQHLIIIRKSKCSTDFKRNDFLKKNEAYPLGALRSLKFAYRKLRISLFVELAV